MLVEAKASRTASPAMAAPLARLTQAIRGYRVDRMVVHRPAGDAGRLTALGPGSRAGALGDLLAALPAARVPRSGKRGRGGRSHGDRS
jgi:hypothetical protein